MIDEILIYNATVVLEDSILQNGAVLLKDRFIEKVFSESDLLGSHRFPRRIDAAGAYVLPGFIDTHSDDLEKVIQPRPQSMIDFEIAMREQEKQLVNSGITTMYHSISAHDGQRKISIRSPENMHKIGALIKAFGEDDSIIRHRFHCRYDMGNISGYDMLLDFIRKKEIHYLSFMDHTPGQGQYRDVEFFKNHIMGNTIDDKEKDRYLAERMNQPKLKRESVKKAADMAFEAGIPVASHDDDTIEKLDYVTRELHATVSEFPVEIEIAKEARRRGMQVVVGAVNILMGRSHVASNLSALEAIREGSADILVSDYFPPSILHAIFKLYHGGVATLPQAVKMATLNPARAMLVGDSLGSIQAGKCADLVLVSMKGNVPMVTSVFVDGVQVSHLNYRHAERAVPGGVCDGR